MKRNGTKIIIANIRRMKVMAKKGDGEQWLNKNGE